MNKDILIKYIKDTYTNKNIIFYNYEYVNKDEDILYEDENILYSFIDRLFNIKKFKMYDYYNDYEYYDNSPIPIFLTNNDNISNKKYNFKYNDETFYYLSNRPFIIWWDNYQKITNNTIYKIWFEIYKFNYINIDSYIYFNILEHIYNLIIHLKNNFNKIFNLIYSIKFFQNGEPFNIIIYLCDNIDNNEDIQILSNIIFIFFENENIENTKTGYTSHAKSEIIKTINNPNAKEHIFF